MPSSERVALTERLARAVRESIASAILFNQRVADDVGMNLRDLQVIHLVQLRGPSTPRDLARWASVTTGGMTVVLDRLERAGYVRRESHPTDRRSYLIHVRLERLKALEGVYRTKATHLGEAMRRYTDRELRLLIEFFDRLNGAGFEEAPVERRRPSPETSTRRHRPPTT